MIDNKMTTPEKPNAVFVCQIVLYKDQPAAA